MIRSVVVALAAVSAMACVAAAQTSTSFTYQGSLSFQGQPYTGTADFRFVLFSAPQDGATQWAPVDRFSIDVRAGVFTTDLDFGAAAFSDSRWLEIQVRTPAWNGTGTPGPLVTLAPRQAVTRSPYSIQTRGIYVNETGNQAGINTVAPTHALDVLSADIFAGAFSSGAGGGTWLNLLNSSAGGRYWRLISTGQGNGEGAGKLLIGHGLSRSNQNTVMAMQPDGAVGIGNISPAARLEVTRFAGATETARFSEPGGLAQLRLHATSSRGEIQGWDGQANQPGVLALNGAGGSVGVGVSGPAARLEVRREAGATETARFSDPGGFSQLRVQAVGFHGELQSWNGSTNQPATMLLNAAGGNVGIGVPGTTALLEVGGGVRARGGAPGGIGANSSGYAFTGNGGDTDSGLFSLANGEVSIFTNATERVRFNSSGLRFTDGSTMNRNQIVASASNFTTDVGTVLGNNRVWVNLSVAGAQPGDVVLISLTGDPPFPFVIHGAHCPGANQVRFMVQNVGALSVDPPPFTYSVVVIRP
ncbi:MAG: hypothetical protein JSR77_17050 [Planctomycetes bacterium]|nr:hypothetical protein [Planctomycetota bacterium]